jgi:hypothetical protein
MAIKKYKIEHEPTEGEIIVEIDFDFINYFGGDDPITMENVIKMLVEFWSGYEYDLEENNHNYLDTFLKSLCNSVLVTALVGNWNLDGVISEFENKEGWPSLDGSYGIKLVRIESMNLSHQPDFIIKELSNEK